MNSVLHGLKPFAKTLKNRSPTREKVYRQAPGATRPNRATQSGGAGSRIWLGGNCGIAKSQWKNDRPCELPSYRATELPSYGCRQPIYRHPTWIGNI
jgi:hypothetical protein